MKKKKRFLSLRSKIFLSFGALVLVSAAVIAAYSASLAASELDAYALRNIDRNIQFVSNEVEAQLRNAHNQAILFANSATVSETLEDYEQKTALEKWESWSALQSTCNMWVATGQLQDVRIHLSDDCQFLRDGLRFISGTDRPETLRAQQGKQTVYWDMFSRKGAYSCFAPLAVGWQQVGYVEAQMDIAPILAALDTRSQTGMSLYLSDGTTVLDADGNSAVYAMGPELSADLENALVHIHRTVGNTRMLYTALKMSGYQLYLISEMPAALLSESGWASLSSIALILGVVLACAFVIAWLISYSICSRLEKLKTAMATVQGGRLDVQVDASSEDEMGQILKTFNHMAADLKVTTETALRNERVGKEAELRLMQAQINPHFIYNTLESISWASAKHDTEHVQYLVRNLSDFLRSTISKTHQMSTVAAEIASIRSYWNIQTYRFGDEIKLDIEAAADTVEIVLLPMLLQPLIENALFHGILCRPERAGHIWLRTELADDLLIVEVEDDGVGIRPEALEHLHRALDSETEGSYGLWNVHQRVRTQYGEEFGLSVQSTWQQGTLCLLTIPARKRENAQIETE